MKSFAIFAVIVAVGAAFGAETFDDAMRRQAAEYTERERSAATALTQARDRVMQEKAPLLAAVRTAQDRLLAAESETRKLETGSEHNAEQKRALIRELDDVAKNAAYANTLAHDMLKAVGDALPPGEPKSTSEQLAAIVASLENQSSGTRAQPAADAADFVLRNVERALGGRLASGSALADADRRLYEGTFAFVGPETFFRSADGARFGSVRLREGGSYPTVYAVPEWKPAEANAFFASGQGLAPVDPSGGKALRLTETKGNWWDHVRKGGAVAFAILGVGLLAAAMITQKAFELARMGMAPPARVRAVLDAVSSNDHAAAAAIVAAMPGATGELFRAGLEHRDEPKPILEEILETVLLEQRLRFERRLPLLAVVATAAPLMGLLGTVVGMVRTFALITVFGTGNAGKLSSGISEVLVTTELGLTVAIPTLVAHGFLAHRIHKNLRTLDKYALQFVTAIESARSEAAPGLLK